MTFDNITILLDLNREIVIKLSGATVMILILIVVGVVGNGFVLYNYVYHFKKTTTWYFIVTLALYDFFICALILPLELYHMLRLYIDDDLTSCRFYRILENSAILGSMWILIGIAGHNYLKICHPFYYIPKRSVLVMCQASLLLTLPMNIPWAFYIFGISCLPTDIPGIIGYYCFVAENSVGTMAMTIYKFTLGALFTIVICCFLTFYGMIVQRMRKQKNFMGSRFSRVYSPGLSTTNQTDDVASDSPHGSVKRTTAARHRPVSGFSSLVFVSSSESSDASSMDGSVMSVISAVCLENAESESNTQARSIARRTQPRWVRAVNMILKHKEAQVRVRQIVIQDTLSTAVLSSFKGNITSGEVLDSSRVDNPAIEQSLTGDKQSIASSEDNSAAKYQSFASTCENSGSALTLTFKRDIDSSDVSVYADKQETIESGPREQRDSGSKQTLVIKQGIVSGEEVICSVGKHESAALISECIGSSERLLTAPPRFTPNPTSKPSKHKHVASEASSKSKIRKGICESNSPNPSVINHPCAHSAVMEPCVTVPTIQVSTNGATDVVSYSKPGFKSTASGCEHDIDPTFTSTLAVKTTRNPHSVESIKCVGSAENVSASKLKCPSKTRGRRASKNLAPNRVYHKKDEDDNNGQENSVSLQSDFVEEKRVNDQHDSKSKSTVNHSPDPLVQRTLLPSKPSVKKQVSGKRIGKHSSQPRKKSSPHQITYSNKCVNRKKVSKQDGPVEENQINRQGGRARLKVRHNNGHPRIKQRSSSPPDPTLQTNAARLKDTTDDTEVSVPLSPCIKMANGTSQLSEEKAKRVLVRVEPLVHTNSHVCSAEEQADCDTRTGQSERIPTTPLEVIRFSKNSLQEELLPYYYSRKRSLYHSFSIHVRRICWMDQTSWSMFVICFTFLMCYMPSLVILTSDVLQTTTSLNMHCFNQYVLKSSFIQNAVHPIIYFAFNTKFRDIVSEQVSRMWKRIFGSGK